MTTVGETLARHLVARGVEVVFGIPGVHTIELYRGLATSGIRHVTPRHEQGAGFMTDGYARVSGKPGVAFVITGPGVTNILTPMAQARADSVPMLVVSGVNALASLGKGEGQLHELPDQSAVAGAVALRSERVECPADLAPAMDRIFEGFTVERPGPAHIEIPLDVAGLACPDPVEPAAQPSAPQPDPVAITHAADLLRSANTPVILAGGGVRRHDTLLTDLAARLGAPVVLTTNARGLMHRHELTVPASASLKSVRDLIEEADVVLALGTEIGPTDYDVYASGVMPAMANLIRVDICPDQLRRRAAVVNIRSDARAALQALLAELPTDHSARPDGAQRAAETRPKALIESGPEMQSLCALLDVMRDCAPGSIMVGDSTQIIYAGDLCYDHDRPGGWFNASTGYGALGYAIPAAIGAAIADPGARVICLTGDGGAQFSLPELAVAVEENLPIVFVVWNNRGYREIETSMIAAGVRPIGCDPAPPDFSLVAASHRMAFHRCSAAPEDVADALRKGLSENAPVMIEIDAW